MTTTAQTAEQILSLNGYMKSPNYGEYNQGGRKISIAFPFSPKLRKPKGELNMSDIILCKAWGFQVIIGHGGIICPEDTFINFPKWATENDLLGAFARMEDFFNQNYEFLPGLPAYIWGE